MKTPGGTGLIASRSWTTLAVCAAVSVFAVGCGSGEENSEGNATSGKAKNVVDDATNAPAKELCGSLQPAAEDAAGSTLAPTETLYDVSDEVGTMLACGYAIPGESDPLVEVSRSWDNPQHTLRGMTGGFDPAECAFTLGIGEFSCLTHESGGVDTATWSEGDSDIAIELVSLKLSRPDVLRLMKAAIELEQIAAEGEESGTHAPKPSNDSASTATQIEQRLKAAGYPVEVEPTAPPRVGTFGVSFEGGPTDGGYEITAYVYETAQEASAELEELNAQFGSPEEGEARVVDTRLYLAVAGPGGAVPAGALDRFIKVAEGTR
jgi:hypothetical protein